MDGVAAVITYWLVRSGNDSRYSTGMRSGRVLTATLRGEALLFPLTQTEPLLLTGSIACGGDAMVFETMQLAEEPTIVAPDGSDVRVLLERAGGSMAHFELAAGHASTAVAHRSVEEIWFFLGGRGEMWRRLGGEESTVGVEAGTCISIPVGASFQFRATEEGPLSAVGVTMPPWPGMDEATPVAGRWPATATLADEA